MPPPLDMNNFPQTMVFVPLCRLPSTQSVNQPPVPTIGPQSCKYNDIKWRSYQMSIPCFCKFAVFSLKLKEVAFTVVLSIGGQISCGGSGPTGMCLSRLGNPSPQLRGTLNVWKNRKRKIHNFLKIWQIKKQKNPLIMQCIINVEKQNFTTAL